MKKMLIISLGVTAIFGGNLLLGSSHVDAQNKIKDDNSSIVELKKIEGNMKVEGKTYKWMEASFGGTHRGYEINPGKLRYSLVLILTKILGIIRIQPSFMVKEQTKLKIKQMRVNGTLKAGQAKLTVLKSMG